MKDQQEKMEKRAQQNREAQRAFRRRKALYIQDLEDKARRLAAIEPELQKLQKENRKLKKAFDIMRQQLTYYKSVVEGVDGQSGITTLLN